MKKILLSITLLLLNFNACSDTTKSTPKYKTAKDKIELNISFADKKWNGKTIPKDEVCSDYHKNGGNSPALTISNLPIKTNYIILSFSDETFKGMRDGGHGIIAYKVKKNNPNITIPSIHGETFTLPTEFKSIQKHQGEKFGKKKGAYLPPCSGGSGNLYTINIKAINESSKENESIILGDANISMGIY